MDFGKIFMRHGILLGHFLNDRVPGLARFAARLRHFHSQVPPPPGLSVSMYFTDSFGRIWRSEVDLGDLFPFETQQSAKLSKELAWK